MNSGNISDADFGGLSDMKVGASAVVGGFVKGAKGYRHKLLAMGLTPGTSIRLTRVAPMGDPVEIEVRGFNMSLRRDEAAALLVRLS